MILISLILYFALAPGINGFQTSEDGLTGSILTFPWDKMRLPETVRPLHYDLFIHPNLTHLNFSGAVHIQIHVLEDTRAIVLHSKDLDIINATLLSSGSMTHLKVLESPALEQVTFVSESSTIRRGIHVLTIKFEADLSESFHGFYKGTYKTKAGETRVMASTQFEPTHARQAFPCFDEPAFKANFTIRMRREARHIAVSNMPKLRTLELPGGLLDDYFDTSVKMSTYLVAYMICDFLSIKKTTQHGVEISVYAVPDKIDQAEYALDTAVKLLDFYDDYFNIPYPLPKQDLAAIPDFQSGAMENWGLTTYRESGLLFDAEKSSPSAKQGITQVIAHELAHQWFGNLVTMEWWNDLWLNEGFAKFMEFMSVDVTHPELQVSDNFLGKCFQAMEVDALSSSHPISTPVETPAQIREMFDDVSYRKGACVLNMLRDFLTPEAFKLGLIRYLRRHSYNNTVNADLWDSLSSICNLEEDHGQKELASVCRGGKPGTSSETLELDIKTVMDTWTLQEGFPMITVVVKGREVKLSQQRYLKGGDSDKTSSFLWQVPLTFITSHSSTVQRFLLKSKQDVLHLPEEVDWIKFNVDMRGYYIVHYEAGGWDALIGLLQKNHTALSSNDRASLINSIFQLVSIGKVSLDKALELSLYLSQEQEVMPVTQGFSELVPLYKLMEKRDMEQLENSMKGYILELFRGLIDRQEWSDQGAVSQRILRSYLLLFACVRHYPPVIAKAETLFQQWVQSNGTMRLPSDVTLVVYTHGARSEAGWDLLLEKYLQSVSPSEKSTIKSALAFSPLTHKLQWMLEKSLEGEVLKTHDLPSMLITVSRNPKGYKLAWDFMRSHWRKLVSKFDLGSSAISRLAVGVTDQYSTQDMLEEVRQFFSSLSPAEGSELRSIQRALETIEENIRWTDQNLPLLKAWLDARTPQMERTKSEL